MTAIDRAAEASDYDRGFQDGLAKGFQDGHYEALRSLPLRSDADQAVLDAAERQERERAVIDQHGHSWSTFILACEETNIAVRARREQP